jgi:hypothetical protein
MTRAPSFKGRSRRVANSAVASACAVGMRAPEGLEPNKTQLLATITQGEITSSDVHTTQVVPALIADVGNDASWRYVEFFAANIRNPHTRRAYARAADDFLAWCADAGVLSIAAVQPVHVATWIEAGDTRARRAERQATACRDPPPVRLARHRPGRVGS